MDFNVPEATDDGLPVNLPPLERQKAVVAAIEKLVAEGVPEAEAVQRVFDDPRFKEDS
ncbi:hypothetical protein [Salinibius halmophilus]|uniref:hypothetical protein n=1 Tax=Salinibius halmophilus TaxID=1853216 RepID=UPI001314714A|nr:hypothetical protein [Salinibius halmophilus]